MRTALFAAFVAAIGVMVIGLMQPGRDDSDTVNRRSGMDVHRDALTGCEYLSRQFGGLVPRMGADGKQVCR
jgi:hypothetical protein